MRRLAIFWLACAAVGFVAAIVAAFALSLALDGAASWRGVTAPARIAQQRSPAVNNAASSNAVLTPALSER